MIVEDGTGITNANSYLSVANANTYHSDRGNSKWIGTDAVKEAALIKATQYLDATYLWNGKIKSVEQSLNWPRTGVLDYNKRDISNIIPNQIKDATAELALASLSDQLLPIYSNSDYIKREKIGELEIEYKDNSIVGRQYSFVSRIIAGLYYSKNSGANIDLSRV